VSDRSATQECERSPVEVPHSESEERAIARLLDAIHGACTLLFHGRMGGKRNGTSVPGSPAHPLIRTARWLSIVILATWFLWLILIGRV